MTNNQWPVLVVDDEPDVLSVSKLAMKNFTVHGLPLKLYTAESKAQAIRVIESELSGKEGMPQLAVAFIDVVMESGSAGLELCEYIRNTMHNHATQLFIRTGQPGVAPEREVIDRYDINGYFAKAQVTEDKLYSAVKSGVRQFHSIQFSLQIGSLTNQLIAASQSRDALSQLIHSVFSGGDGSSDLMSDSFLLVDGQSLGGNRNESEFQELCKRLDKESGISLSPGGDKYVVDEEHNQLVRITGSRERAEVFFITKGAFPMSEVARLTTYAFWSSFATLWRRAV